MNATGFMPNGLSYGSVFSGIEAATLAFTPLGFKAAWFSEIEPFACALLAHRYPHVANLGDVRQLPEMVRQGRAAAPDVLCGGSPCQAFSIAGQQRSMHDPRGQLTLTYVDLANAIDEARMVQGLPPAVILWENVPGVLTVHDNAFGSFIAALAGESRPLEPPGGRWSNAGYVRGPRRCLAWRVLDAQYFGVAQRRRRVFVVASSRAWDFDCAATLFESPGRPGGAPKGLREKSEVARSLTRRSGSGGQQDAVRGSLTVAYAPDVSPTLLSRGKGGHSGDAETCALVVDAVGFNLRQDPVPAVGMVGALDTHAGTQGVLQGERVRRLTPSECEVLQGFPPGYTAIPYKGKSAAECPLLPRYRAIGNSWAVPVARWVARRLYYNLLSTNTPTRTPSMPAPKASASYAVSPMPKLLDTLPQPAHDILTVALRCAADPRTPESFVILTDAASLRALYVALMAAEGVSAPAPAPAPDPVGMPALELPAVGMPALELPAVGMPALELPAVGMPAADSGASAFF